MIGLNVVLIKSRTVRMTGDGAMDSARCGYYLDKLHELQLIVRFLEGREEEKALTESMGPIIW